MMLRSLRRTLLAATVALVSTAAVAQQQRAPSLSAADGAVDWKKHTFAEDRFEIEFSGPVRSEPVPLDGQSRRRVVRSTHHLQETARAIYIVGAQHNADVVNFDAGIKGSFATLKCKATEPETDMPIGGGRGRELKGRDCFDGAMRAEARYYEVGKWFYQVMAIYAKDGDEAAARRFLQSFKVIGR